MYARLKGELGVLDYDDLIHTTYGLLMEDEIAEIYRDKIDYVFVDEFQDTNSVQDALIERICEDGKRFIVGDVKQSIYSFRLADPRVFLKKAKEIGAAGEVIFMNDNFRSSWEIISDVNELMGSLMKDMLGGIDYSDEERLKPNREKTDTGRGFCAHFRRGRRVLL
ncbi:MAG: UvrD-helicase domain-containing protein [Lachnospiraceae bacterium]